MKDKKSYKNFIVFWLGSLVAVIGSGMSSFTIGIYVFQSTNSASAKALISLLAFLPGIALSPFAGILADKYDRRKLMIASDGLSSLGILLILFSFYRGFTSYSIIALGVFISSIFSSAMEPSFRATVTDLVEEENYTKASGMIQLATSARFLISPILATLVYSHFGLEMVLIIDLMTIFFTILSIQFVRKGLVSKPLKDDMKLIQGFKEGLKTLTENKGLTQLILLSTLMCFSMGFLDELSTPMILSFTNSQTLGYSITFSALGMVLGSIVLSIRPIKKDHIPFLSLTLFIAGFAMVGFGFRENILLVSLFGFLFFFCLPFANAILDYLIRVNVPNEIQGRIWGFVGIISQMGFVFAYILAGPLSDAIFRPLLKENGPLESSIGKIIGVGSGRGMGLLIILGGIILSLVALGVFRSREIRRLEKGGEYVL